MKKFILILICSLVITLLIDTKLKAQNYSFEPISKQLDTTMIGDNFYTFTIKFHNLKADSLSLTWEFISNTFNTGWDNALCDWLMCYGAIPIVPKTPPGIPPGGFGFFKLLMGANSIAGEGKLKLKVYETFKPSFADTVTFNITSFATGINKYNNGTLNSLYPNPSSDYIFLKAENRIENVEIYDVLGKKAEVLLLNKNEETRINIADLAPGAYFIRYVDGQKVISTKTFYKMQ